MRLTKILSLILALLLPVLAGCGTDTPAETTAATTVSAEATPIGEGQYVFPFTATFLDGSAKHYTVSTDCATVGEALLSLGLIEGEDGPFGIYVKSVCGVVADYDVDQTYWALYIDGEMAMSGVDTVSTADAGSIEFRVSK